LTSSRSAGRVKIDNRGVVTQRVHISGTDLHEALSSRRGSV